MVWSYGQNFPMRKVRGAGSYQPTKFPKRFLEIYFLKNLFHSPGIVPQSLLLEPATAKESDCINYV
jgi:hypothetical protein